MCWHKQKIRQHSSNHQTQHPSAQPRCWSELKYSKAMNLLRSPGLAPQSLEEIVETLQALHPQEDQLDLTRNFPLTRNASTFAFITGKWFSCQICSSAKCTAVDQWGWASREMWEQHTHDHDLMKQVANIWLKPLAACYLPSCFSRR